MIHFDRVGFSYPQNVVLADLTLGIGAGEAVGLFGANGAGKTTVLRLCMALLQPSNGKVTVAGQATTGLGPEDLAGQVGFLFQRPEDQLIRTTVRAELAYGPERLGWDEVRTAEAVQEALALCQLERNTDTHPYDLSLPKRRMVALASVLVTAPKVLLLDEPTALLDRNGRALVAEIVRGRAAAGCAVVAVVHDPAFAIEALGRGIALGQGRVLEDGSVEQVLRSGAAGLTLPPAVIAAERAGVSAKSLRMADLAAALAMKSRQ
jgi:energy-coupling factor transporter ATP-binding protein EcfA2